VEYRTFGRTGIQVSPWCLGTMNFGGPTDEQQAQRIVQLALDHGINFVDTANCYQTGVSEEILGRALTKLGAREKVVLASKVNVRMGQDPNAAGNHRRHVIEQCHASLRRLGTDYLDVYYIHRPSTQVPIDETLRAMDDLVRDGLVRYIGTSSFAAWQLLESLWASKEYGLNRVVCEQSPYHPLDRRIERELLPMAQTYGIAVTAWSPLAGGFLTGKYRRGAQRTQGRFRDTGTPSDWDDRHFADGAFDVLEVLTEIADEKGCTTAQLTLAWCAAQPGMVGPVLGPRTVEQFTEQIGAAEVTVTDEDRARIDAAARPGGCVVPYYLDDATADFRPHAFRW
jgi:aryl-alcohol dehydrogenase-like predicted oxidoreductase